ncbi:MULTISPECIES: hypothetical protein [unclassified Nitratiruptor]|uniref:hypothetical protein n=1 Tax=unclassified Nitratiruptor TaxID=2624044 RepID=UPI001914F0CF|nr:MULTISPECIES: hypothetical protein [unclassified Nitratiruptor]BCD59601.1 hypothetical protein NitYY0810_C0352 [Nitratiruptor sp. YY08-10]BCD63525.1 hypothetical protein NitYY0814_C0352 [Nitratiruptor sp. YY08-14]BCD83077.1 hypothetical protein NrS2_27 [Nitratiruptor phage NrS-2]BCD83143.1 hypothetical protein NrS3_27 [Nitratiruptor phage NrS-3]
MDTVTAMGWSIVGAFFFMLIAGIGIYIVEFFERIKKSKDVDIYEPYGYGKYRKVER